MEVTDLQKLGRACPEEALVAFLNELLILGVLGDPCLQLLQKLLVSWKFHTQDLVPVLGYILL